MDDTNNTNSHPKKELIIKSSRELISKWAKIHFRDYIEQLDQHLFKLIEKSDNNANQTRYSQTRDELNHQDNTIQDIFLKQVNIAFDHYLQGNKVIDDANVLPPESTTTLRLIENNDLEETLAINSMSQKTNTQCAEVLHSLNQRLSVLRGGKKLGLQSNPVAPGVFAEATKIAMANLTLDNISKLVTFKVFESAFMGKLAKLYDLLSQHYEHLGLLPNLTRPVKLNQPSHLPDELQAQTSKTSMTHQVELFEAIKELQAQQPAVENLTQHPLPIAQIINSIARLQQDAATLLNSLESSQVKLTNNAEELRQKSEKEALKTENVDTHVIEIVGLLFEYMLNDQQLPDSVKTVLSYLHTPFLKIALIDKDFFSHPEHPARQLLNSLVAAGERWVEPAGKHKNDVFLQIKAIVQRLLSDFDNDVRLFSELAFEFNHYLRQHSRRIRLSEKRAMQAAKGEDKLKEIRLKVESYLKKRIGNIQLSATIQALLFEPWANFLSFNLLRFGSQSEQWRMAAQTVDDILWVSQPHNANNLKTRQKLLSLSKTLPQTLQIGFDTVGYDASQAAHLLKTLHQQHILHPQTTSDITPETKPTDANIDDVNITYPAEIAAQKDALLLRLKKLEPGTWFLFNVGTDKVQRVKLAWSNSNTLHFMFVNRMGQQVAVKTGKQLAQDIRNNHVKILSKLDITPFFEKAMERVLEQLKQRESNPKTSKD